MVSPFSRRRRVTSMLHAAGRRCRSWSLTAALVVVVLGVLGGGVVVHAGVAAQRANVDVAGGPAAPSSGAPALKGFVPGDRALKSGAAERLTERGAPARPQRAGREERLRSRVALRGASRAALLKAGRLQFAGVFSDPLFDGRHPDPGKTVIDYRGARGALVKDAGGRKLLLKSTLPLQAPAANGQLAPVDLSLRENAETFTTTNSNVDVQIFKDPARGIAFVNEDFSVSDATATGGARPDGVQTDGRVFFDQAAGGDLDVGFIAVPKPTGVQVGWLLGTADAPQTYKLNLDLPEGARVRRTQTDDPIPGDPPRTFEIVDRDGKSLAYITPPMTVDSDGVNVESSMHIVGRDRLVVDVKHHGEDLRYPLFVDPELIPVPRGRWGGDWQGWGTYQTPTTPTRVASDYNHNYYGWALDHPAYNPSGAYMSMPTNTWFDIGTSRGFEYRAPAGTYVAEATFGNISHQAIWPTGNHNMWWWGILNPARDAWQNVYSSYASGSVGSAGMSAGGAAEQNYANIGIGATAANYQGRLWSGNLSAWVKMDWANVYLGDPHPPQLTSAPPANENWSTATTRTRTVSASDHGSGIVKFRLTGPGIDQTTPLSYGEAQNITYTLAEGSHEYTLTAIDAAGNTSSPHTWTEKIDRTSPLLAQPSGELWEARDRADDKRFGGLYGPGYALHVTANDAHSGIKNIEVYVDNFSQAGRGGIANGQTLDWTLRPDDYTDGSHTIKIITRDNVDGQAGAPDRHTDTTSFDVVIDRRGDVVSGEAWTDDPDLETSDLEVSETTQLLTDRVRIEDLDRTRTIRRIDCSAQSAGCLELREQAPDDTAQPDAVTAVVDESATGDRVRSESVLLDSIATTASPQSTGPIAGAAAPWQVLPPGHGATFGRYQATEDIFVDGEPTTVALEVLADQQTKLPIRLTRTLGSDVEAVTYLTYAPQRVEAVTLPSEYFGLGGAAVTSTTMPAAAAGTSGASAADDDALVAQAKLMRASLGLETADSFVRDITLNLALPTREAALDAIGIPLDASELDEITTRFELQGRASDLLAGFASSHTSDYAGSYIDQQTGKLYAGFTTNQAANLASVRALIGLEGRVEAFVAMRSLEQLNALRTSIRADWINGTLDPYGVNALAVDAEDNAVTVGVEHFSESVRDAIVARYGAGVTVEEQPAGDPIAELNPNNVAVKEAIGGIEILSPVEGGDTKCTSGFGATKRSTVSGRRHIAYYVLTAGHCAAEGDRKLWRHLNGGDASRPFYFGRTERNAFYYDDPSDALAIRITTPTKRSSRMFVRYRNNEARTDARVKGPSDFAVKGSIVCYSGATSSAPAGNRSICGQISAFKKDVKADGKVVGEGIDIDLKDDCRSRRGDSGAGVWMKKRKTDKGIWAVGILHDQIGRIIDCGLGALADNPKTKMVRAQGIGPVLRKFGMSLNTQTATQE